MSEKHFYALYYKNADGAFDGPAVGLFESEQQARHHVFNDALCPRTEFEIVRHTVHGEAQDGPDKGNG